MAGLSLKNVEKTYPNGAHAIQGVNMEIKDGEFIVFVGPSGCGKSTLLRMIAGLETITKGEVSIGDRVVNKVTPSDRNVAMVFQNYALYPHMSVRGNMSYGLKNRGLAKAEIKQKVEETAKMLRIHEYLDRQPRQLSGGQRQRVAMGRAIVRNPEVFLFDEPLSNLDAKLRVRMRIEIKRLQRSMNVTSIYVTHDQTEAMTLADRLVVINEGLIEQIGVPMDLYNDPASLFVAEFIGAPQINIISGQSKGDKFISGDLTLGGFGDLPDGVEVAFGIRPDHLRIDPKGDLKMRVDLVEHHGADNLVYGELLDAQSVTSIPLEICIKVDEEVSPKIDETINLAFDRDAAFIFDKKSGARLR